MREYFCAYHDMLNGTRKLSDAECGRLFRALLCYSAKADVGQINLQGREEVLFDVYSQQIDRDVKAYEATIARSKENGSKGGRPKKNLEKPLGYFENPENPGVFEKTQKTQEEEKDKEKEKDNHHKNIGEPETGGGGRPDFDTLEAYCSSNLQYVSPRNMEDIAAYKDELPEDVIRHAVDVACAQGKRTWAYTNSILRRYVERGFKTLGDVKADEDRYAAGKEKTEKQVVPLMKRFD